MVFAGKFAQGKPIEELLSDGSYKMNYIGVRLEAGTDSFEVHRRHDDDLNSLRLIG